MTYGADSRATAEAEVKVETGGGSVRSLLIGFGATVGVILLLPVLAAALLLGGSIINGGNSAPTRPTGGEMSGQGGGVTDQEIALSYGQQALFDDLRRQYPNMSWAELCAAYLVLQEGH